MLVSKESENDELQARVKTENVPSCSRDYGILVVKSSHAKAVDGVDLATAAARAALRFVAHLDYEIRLYFKKGLLK